jgi:hypothetical protein
MQQLLPGALLDTVKFIAAAITAAVEQQSQPLCNTGRDCCSNKL